MADFFATLAATVAAWWLPLLCARSSSGAPLPHSTRGRGRDGLMEDQCHA